MTALFSSNILTFITFVDPAEDDDEGEFISVDDDTWGDEPSEIYSEDVPFAAKGDGDAMQGRMQTAEHNRSNTTQAQAAPRLTRVEKNGDSEIHFLVPIGHANKTLKLSNGITFPIFRGSVADVMGLTVAQLVLGYFFEWNIKGGKPPVPMVLSDDNDFLDMIQGIQGHRREQAQLLGIAKEKKQNTSKFKITPKVTLIDLRESPKGKVSANPNLSNCCYLRLYSPNS